MKVKWRDSRLGSPGIAVRQSVGGAGGGGRGGSPTSHLPPLMQTMLLAF